MEQNWNLNEALEYYRSQGAPQNQNALVELLREVQKENGNAIPQTAIDEIADKLNIKTSFLSAIIKHYPSLRTEEAPHLLEICNGERCQNKNCGQLKNYIEKTYYVKNGRVSKTGGFSYKTVGCMNNCAKGPNIKWDGKLYSNVNEQMLKSVIK